MAQEAVNALSGNAGEGRFWTTHYPAGIPADLPSAGAEHTSLAHFFIHVCQLHRPKTAFISLGTELSYGQLLTQAQQFCSGLQHLGIQPGDRVAIMMPNLLQYPVSVFGTLMAGAVVVNTNPLYTARELRHQLQDAGARVLVVAENFAHTAAQALIDTCVEHIVITSIGDLLGPVKGSLINAVVKYVRKGIPPYHIDKAHRFRDLLSQGKAHPGNFNTLPASNDLAFLQYTGGTTGTARAALLTHRNLLANMDQAHQWIKGSLRTSQTNNDQETVVTALPLYHIFALTGNCLTFLKLGGRNILITNPRDIKGLIKTLRTHSFSAITGVNTLFNALLEHQDIHRVSFSRLKVTLGGGMAVEPKVAQRWHAVTGNHLTQAYGLTEASPAVAINPLGLPYNGSVGLPVPGTDVIVCNETGDPLPPGQVGQVYVRGPQVSQGYWCGDNPPDTHCLVNGFFRTGDIGHMDHQGFLTLIDRLNDLIIVSGFNVYPNEVEQVVRQLDGIKEVAAIGEPSEQSGQSVKLFVIPDHNAPSVQAIVQHCRAHLAAYKVPRSIVFCDSLPRSPLGKVLRRALRSRSDTPDTTQQIPPA